MAVVEEQWAGGTSAQALAAASLVVDLDAEESTCPACEGRVPGSAPRCPSCGLRFH